MSPQLNLSEDRLPAIAGYQVTQQLYAGKRTLVYRGIRLADTQPVVLKLLRSDRPAIQDLLRLRNYYTITHNLNLPGIVQPLSLDPYGNGFLLVMPDDQSLALSDYRITYPLSLAEVLTISIQLTEILHELYQHRVIHKDIKPANILIHPETKQIKLIDFSIASLLPKEAEEVKPPNILEGTLAYLSPEQTGRMNRGVDYRSDFYALGVTLFELFTGQLPFQSSDLMELIHAHMTVQPPLAHDFNLDVPPILSEIITKLMAKNAEDRYQSALGLKYDLACCQRLLPERGNRAWFTLGERDICDRFLIPERLYGREIEVTELLNAFNRVSSGTTELLLIAGFAGIGKTALVNEVHKPIIRQRGYFIKGKFNQFDRNIPLSGFVQALRDLIRQLLAESDAKLKQWQTELLAAVVDNGQVLIDLIPELEYIIGKQPPVPELLGIAAQQRFNWLFQKFIQVFTAPEHPLVIFLDDLQWADSASLQLIKVLMEDNGHLLLLGAYRDNEVFSAHPFQLTINDLQRAGKIVNTLILTPLGFQETNQWVADTLHCSTERSRLLTEFVVRKTQGNPFFTTQFLKALHHDRHITFNHEQGCWECDITHINALSLTDDVVEFMAQQVQKLPEPTQQILKLAACIGNQFDLETLSIVSEQSAVAAAAALWNALEEELILPQSEVYKFYLPQQATDIQLECLETITYRFLHDRVQQAVYSLVPHVQKPVMHYKIGQRLLNSQRRDDREERIFEIVNQNNSAIALIEHSENRQELARLNLVAGRKARNTMAYEAAAQYFVVGRRLLTSDCWQTQYDLALALYTEAAEVASCSTDLDQMEILVETVLYQAKNKLDKVRVYVARITAYTSQGQLIKAIQTGLTALKLFGVDLPESPTLEDIDRTHQTTQALLGNQQPIDLLNLTEITNPQILAILEIIHVISVPAYLTNPLLNSLIILQHVNLLMSYGNAPNSIFGYSSYGLFLCAVKNEIEQGYDFAQLALTLLTKFPGKKVKARIMFVIGAFIWHRKVHIRDVLKLLQEAYFAGWESSNFAELSYAAYFYSFYAYLMGDELLKLSQEMASYSKVLSQTKQYTQLSYNELYRQTILGLLGQVENPFLLFGQVELEQELLAQYQQKNDKTGQWHFYFIKVMLCCLFQELELAAQYIEQAESYISNGKGMFNIPAFHFYAALIWLALCSNQSPSGQEQLLQKAIAHQNQIQNWATYAPMNHQHKFYLVEAEKQRVLAGKSVAVIELYDRAIVEAKENGFIQDEALANELAARFYLDWGRQTIAEAYLQKAYYAYARWGAQAKVHELEQRYPQLLLSITHQAITPVMTGENLFTSQTCSYPNQVLDIDVIIKASQALSSEIYLDQLLQTLIQTVVTSAGADKAALFLKEDDSLKLAIKYAYQAIQSLEQAASDRHSDDHYDIPLSLIHYVEHTLETVITDHKTHFSTHNDLYCLRHQPQSLLCTPILYQGRLLAVLYLENAVTTAAFTDDRVTLLKILCAQAAISLENARLYQQAQSYAQQLEQANYQLENYSQTLEHLVEERTQVLSQTLAHLQSTQQDLIQSEKMAALGQLTASVAHEINTPLGVIRAATTNILAAFQESLQKFPGLLQQLSSQQYNEFLILVNTALQQPSLSTQAERHLRRQWQTQLESQGISGSSRLARQLTLLRLEPNFYPYQLLLSHPNISAILETAANLVVQHQSINNIQQEVDRAAKIVFALKTYSRRNEVGEQSLARITDGLEVALTLYHNRLKHGIKVIRHYNPEIPAILCNPDELTQVWANLIDNAIYAIGQQGCLQVTARHEVDQVVVEITDSGIGIPSEVQTRIFEPFFTTKPRGEGSGLGLDIVRQIIQKHGGEIQVQSQPGCTTFTIVLPIRN